MCLSRILYASILLRIAAGHGAMTMPSPRTNMTQMYAGHCAGAVPPASGRPINETGPQDGPCDWYNQGCQPGCTKCIPDCGHIQAGLGKCCDTPMEPTVTDPELRTFQNLFGHFDIGFKYSPWRSPGFAPVLDACGEAGGEEPGASISGFKVGAKGSKLPKTRGPQWAAGSKQEVSWGLFANHGGGYSYRLCSKSDNITEECFQRNPLQFVGNTSWIQYSDDKANRTAIPATRTSEGTNPPGSQWTRNPIPACSGYMGGVGSIACNKAQFEPVLKDVIKPHPKYAQMPGLYGFGPGAGYFIEDEKQFWTARFNFNIIDEVMIPADLPAGDYVLGFRWDCEQTPQIWQNCADVTITQKPVIV